MHYFIDGYNLMFRVVRAGSDLQMQREAIVRDLNRKIQKVGIDATLVFDSQYQASEGTRSHLKHLEICFTDLGQSADEYILLQLRRAQFPRQHLVVTSDKKLAWLARRQGAHTETVEDFLKQLNNRYRNKLKASKEAFKPLIPAQPIQAPSPSIEKISPEDCFNFYLEKFETNFQEILKSEPTQAKKADKTSKKKPKIKKFKHEPGLSDMDYWLKAFEQPPEEE
jgi:uncharacterized protein